MLSDFGERDSQIRVPAMQRHEEVTVLHVRKPWLTPVAKTVNSVDKTGNIQDELDDIYARLRQRIKELGPREAGRRYGYNYSALSRIANGKQPLSVKTLLKLATKFGIR